MTIYCYDTEFLEDGNTIELISIGIVCEDGREYYAVNSDMPEDRIHKDYWLINNVWKHLPVRGLKTGLVGSGDNIRIEVTHDGTLDRTSTVVKPKWVIANEVREFLLAAPDPELWAYYAAYDHVALAQLWGKMIHLPTGIPMWTHELMQLAESIPNFVEPEATGEHHALADARWNYELLKAAKAEM
ncbi:DnaQ-like DNA polymerase III subunit [Mycobacterium phage Soul22]|uniref:DnaQ-like DNA polymerase III subunit n=1 Tax=Mycobacterium phage Soul22 TaxID=2743996 RepID=A0A7D5JUT1_9CAUD|nr:Rnase H [Mycobacterium phage Soul22]QLF84312.1 DnaQ-like DNA polymerase III subunit [Mycobacterium phage Soul22]